MKEYSQYLLIKKVFLMNKVIINRENAVEIKMQSLKNIMIAVVKYMFLFLSYQISYIALKTLNINEPTMIFLFMDCLIIVSID